MRALELFAETDCPTHEREARRAANSVIDRVAQRLGNTRTVCRDCYVHPAIVPAWRADRLAEQVATIRRRLRRPLAGLDSNETIAL